MASYRLLKAHAVLSTLAIVTLIAVVIHDRSGTRVVDTLSVRHIDVLDSEGRIRLQLAGEFGPRRRELAGLLFHNEDGNEAGGLVFAGRKDEDGAIQAAALLSFDQYAEDQIMSLAYSHSGDTKRNGMLIMDRPDELGENMRRFYQAFSEAETEEERNRLREEVLPTIPREELPAKRLYFGRTTQNTSTIDLHDPLGRLRLKLEVGSDGVPRIEFFDEEGVSVKAITVEPPTPHP